MAQDRRLRDFRKLLKNWKIWEKKSHILNWVDFSDNEKSVCCSEIEIYEGTEILTLFSRFSILTYTTEDM